MNNWLKTLIAVGVIGVVGVGVYFAVPAITDKTWGEILHLDKPSEVIPAEKCKLTLNTNGNLTFICADDKGNTYTEEELEAKEWQGETLTFTLAPNNGFMLWSTKVNDEEITLENNMFTLTMNQDTTIDVDVQELREYTVNIVEDRYVVYSLKVNGNSLNTGDTIRTGDVISGRVHSRTTGWKIGTFLIDDVAYAQNLDKLGYFSEIRFANTDSEEIQIVADCVQDKSSNFVIYTPVINNVILFETPEFTDPKYAVYEVWGNNLWAGQEVKVDFTITKPDLFEGITLNGEPLRLTLEEDGVTGSVTFTVPENEAVLEAISSFEEYSIDFDYDETKISLSMSAWMCEFDEENKKFIVKAVPTLPSFFVTINLDNVNRDNAKLVVKQNGFPFDEITNPSSSERVEIDFNTTNVEIYVEENVSFEPYNVTFNYDETKVLVDFLGGDPVGDDNKTFTVVDSNANLSFVVNDVDLAPNSIVNIDCDDGTSYSFTVDELPAMDLPITSSCRNVDITILEQSEPEATPIFINLEYDPLLFSVSMNPVSGNCTFDGLNVVTSYGSTYSFELTFEILDPAYFDTHAFEIYDEWNEPVAISVDVVDNKFTITVDENCGEFVEIRVIEDILPDSI